METLFQRARKLIAFILVLAMNQMILGPIFVLDTYAASTVFTDDVSLTPVQSDTVQIDVTAGTDITSAKWRYYFGSCPAADFTSADSLTLVDTGSATTSFAISDESHNGEYVCVEVIDNGLTSYVSSNPIMVDITPPVITLSGSSTVDTIVGASYTDSGATCTDNISSCNVVVDLGGVNFNATGSYTANFSATDVAGNTATGVTRTINVVDVLPADITPPVVTIVGNNPENLLVGDTFVDSGATWTDNVDGSGVIANYSSGTLNTSATGSYSLEYIYVDVAGNTGSAIRTVNVVDAIPPDTTAPVVTLIGSGTMDILSGSVWVDPGATWTDNVDGSGTIATASSGTVDTALTGSYILEYTYVDAAGNTGSTTRTVNVVDILPSDTTPPVVTIVGDNPQNLLVGDTFVDSGATWTDNVDGSGVIANYGSGILNTTATGSYSLEYIYVDVAGNTGSAIRTVNVTDTPDTTPPTATVEYSNTGATNQPVVATLTGSSEPITITNNSGSTTYTFTTNGTFTFDFEDAVGNTGSVTATVNNIDLVAPSAIIDYTPSTTTSGAVVATLTGALENITITNNSGSNQYIFTNTGSFTFDYVDDAGNTGSTTATVTWIDLIPPTATVEYSTTAPTNGTVVVALTGASEPITIINNSGSDTYAFTSNGTFTFDFEDLVGNTGSVTATVNNIDTTVPVVTLNGSGTENLYQNDTWTDLGATWTDNVDGSGVIVSGTGLVNTTLTGTYTVDYTYTDTAGNTTTVTRTINVLDIPDTTPPTATVEYSTTGATNQPVIATLTGASETITITNNSGSNTYTFTDNGSFTFDFVDNAGNTGSVIATVTNIDLVVPTATVDYSPSTTTSGSVIATLTGASEPIVITNNSGSDSYTFTGNGIFTFEFIDVAGNTGSTVANVGYIDATLPVVTVSGEAVVSGEYGTPFVDDGATWTDNVDGSGVIASASSGSVNIFALGTYLLEYFFQDSAGNTGSGTRTVHVIDTTAPVLTVSGEAVVSGEYGIPFVDDGANWTDAVDGSGTIASASSGSVNIFSLGTYILEYFFQDSSGNTGSTTRTVNIIDTTPPVVTVSGEAVVSGEYGIPFFDDGATWTDNVDGSGVIASASTGSANILALGTYILSYIFQDSSGNTGSTTRTVHIIDTTAPVVTLNGSGVENLYQNDTWTDLGATWTDAVDGSGVIVSGTGLVNTSLTGTYTVDYAYTDTSGNTGSATRIINVFDIPDTTPPTATIEYTPSTTTSGAVLATLTGASEPITITNNSGSNTYTFITNGSFTFDFVDAAGNTGSTTATVTWIDTTPPTATVEYSNTGATNQPVVATLTGASESITITNNTGTTYTFFANGSFTFDFVDAAGNTGSATATVNNIDTTLPVVTLVGSGIQNILLGSGWTDLGATWTDNVDGSGSIPTGTGLVNTSQTGTYFVTYSYTDTAGNTGSVTRQINVSTVLDTTAPVITLIGSGTITVAYGSIYTDSGATCTDDIDPTCTITTTGSVNTSQTGSYTITYNAADLAGNIAIPVTRTINVADLTAPVITLLGPTPLTISHGSVYIDAGATCADNIACGPITVSGSVDAMMVGTYTLTYSAQDTSGNPATPVVRTVHVVDTTAPVVSLNGSGTENLYQNDTWTDLGATWTDNVDGSGVIVSGTGLVNTTLTGIYTVNYIYVDAAGNTGSATRTVNVLNIPDTTPPTAIVEYSNTGATNQPVVVTLTGASEPITITNNSGSNQYTFAANGTFTFDYQDAAGNTGSTTATVTWIDVTVPTAIVEYSNTGATNQSVIATLTGASEPITITNNSGSNTYTFAANGSFTFDFVDAVGNTGSTTATVSNIDTTAPVVTLSGSSPEVVAHGSVYVDAGATWTDNVDGSGTILSATSGSVNTSQTGTYLLQYTYTDTAGNTGSAIRTVTVTDQTAPVITLSGSTPITVAYGSIYVDAGATCVDNVDASCIVTISGTVNTAATGTYILTYNAADLAGNTATPVTRTVTVADLTAPVITLVGASPLTVAYGSTYTDSGATCTDNLDTTCTVTTTGSVNTSATGTYLITYTAADLAGNVATPVTRTVNVTDLTAPIVTLLGSGTITLTQGATWSDPGATWSDNLDGTGSLTGATSGAVNTAVIGTYTLTYTHTDLAGNIGSTTRVVNVIAVPSTPSVGPGGGGGSEPLFNYLGNLIFFFPTKIPPVYTGTTLLLDLIKVPVQYRNAIKILKNKNILPDFNLNGKMTRIEFVHILALLQGYKEVAVEKVFADVTPGSETEKYIAFGVSEGWINTKNYDFRPYDTITLGEATKILGTILGTHHAESRVMSNIKITRARAIDLIVKTLGIE